MFDQYSKVEDFVNDNLQGNELEAFKKAMANDPELRIVVENHSLYSLIADEVINDNISSKISEAQRKQRNNKYGFKKAVFFIALFLLFVLSVYYYSIRSDKNYARELYTEYYISPYDTERGAKLDPGVNVECEKAHGYLELNEFDKGKKELLENVKSDDVFCKEKSYYLLALLEVKNRNYQLAQDYLGEVLLNDDSGYEVNARKLLEKIK